MTLHPLREQFFRLNDFKTTARRREDKERKLTRKENMKRKTTKSVTDIKGSSSRRRDCFDTFQLPLLFPITTHPSLLLFPNQLAILSSFVSSLFFFDVFSIWLFSEKFQAIGCNDEKERKRERETRDWCRFNWRTNLQLDFGFMQDPNFLSCASSSSSPSSFKLLWLLDHSSSQRDEVELEVSRGGNC